MAYIGKTPTVGNFVKLDALTASATASYTMQVDSVNFSPESVNHMLVSLNGVIQSPTTSYTISGSTITFASALTSSDSIDFIMVYGNVLDIGTVSDSTISTAKIINDAVTVDKLNLISTGSVPSLEAKGTSGVTEGYIQLNCAENSHGIKLKSPPHSANASYTLTFPTTDGNADEFLQTNGSGTLTWATAGGGGKINQVLQTVKTDVFSTTSSSFVDVTGLSVNITPTATNSKILVSVNLSIHSSDNAIAGQLFRDSTQIALGDGSGSRSRSFGAGAYGGTIGNTILLYPNIQFLDSPNTTSQVTYKVKGAAVGGGTLYYGRTDSDTDNHQFARTPQVITVMEVLA